MASVRESLHPDADGGVVVVDLDDVLARLQGLQHLDLGVVQTGHVGEGDLEGQRQRESKRHDVVSAWAIATGRAATTHHSSDLRVARLELQRHQTIASVQQELRTCRLGFGHERLPATKQPSG